MCDARHVVAVTIFVVSVALLDALNPSTIVPAVVLALGDHPARRVASFTAGVFAVSTAGGLVILFAFGRTLLARIAHPSAHVRGVLELTLGIALLAVAGFLWTHRDRIWRGPRAPKPGGRGSLFLGAGIMAVELPTAFPYFAAILAIVGAVHGAAGQAVLIVLYNAIFVAPLVAVVGLAAASGAAQRTRIARLSDLVTRLTPVVVPFGAALIGAALIALGTAGLVG